MRLNERGRPKHRHVEYLEVQIWTGHNLIDFISQIIWICQISPPGWSSGMIRASGKSQIME